MTALVRETFAQRTARIAGDDRMLARERQLRERLILFFERASAQEAKITGLASPWSVAIDALKGSPVPAVEPEQHTWFSALLSAPLGGKRDAFTTRRLARLVDDLAVGLAHAGPFDQLGDLAERLSEFVADAFPAKPAGPVR